MYTKYYGLSQKPFENTPDASFLFLSKQHREILSSLLYGIDSAKGFILVAGDVGTGKTTLINAFLKEVDPLYIILHIINPRSTFQDMLEYLIEKIGLEIKTNNNPALINAIRDQLEMLDTKGRRVILIIDEAHLLKKDALEDLRLLSNIETQSKKLIQIILVGQNEIYDKLNSEKLAPLKQRLVINRHLRPLNKTEASDYIRHRISVAGRHTPLFDKKALVKIWHQSLGTPRLINQICDNALLIGFAMESKIINAKIIKEVIQDMAFDHISINRKKFRFFINALKWGLGPALAIILFIFFLLPNIFPNLSRQLPSAQPPSNKPFKISEKVSEHRNSHETIIAKDNQIRLSTATSISPGIDPEKPETGKINKPLPKPKPMPKLVPKQPETAPQPVSPVKKIQSKSPPVIDLSGIVGSKTNKIKIIEPGEWLKKILYKEYKTSSDTLIDIVQVLNPAIHDINRIYTGQKILLPNISLTDLIVLDEKGKYYIFYASFYRFSEAEQFLEQLNRNTGKAHLFPVKQKNNLVYRLFIGSFSEYNEALHFLNSLDKQYWRFIR